LRYGFAWDGFAREAGGFFGSEHHRFFGEGLLLGAVGEPIFWSRARHDFWKVVGRHPFIFSGRAHQGARFKPSLGITKR
jgi:hypothetical protein